MDFEKVMAASLIQKEIEVGVSAFRLAIAGRSSLTFTFTIGGSLIEVTVRIK
jgi:hypothetical protein